MKRANRAILWDVGGTLVEFACSLPESVRHRLNVCGYDHSKLSDEHIEQSYSEFIRGESAWRSHRHEQEAELAWITALLKYDSLLPADVQRLHRAMPRYFDLYRPVRGLIDLLQELKNDGIPMAIVSNWPPSLPEFLNHHNLSRYFSPINYSAQDGVHKPDVTIFERTLAELNTPADHAIFVGDHVEFDILPARVMGMRTIHFDPRHRNATFDADDIPGLRKILESMLETG